MGTRLNLAIGMIAVAAMGIIHANGAEGPATHPATAPSTLPSASTAVPTTLPVAAAPKLKDIPGFRTVETAIPAKVLPAARNTGLVGYLGIATARDAGGKLVIQQVDAGSPAGKADLKEGDVILRAGDGSITHPDMFQEWLLGHTPGDVVKLAIVRGDKEMEISATLTAASRPMKAAGQRGIMGVQLLDSPEGVGALIDRVTPDLPADRAGLKAGDLLVQVDGVAFAARQALSDALSSHSPDDEVKLTIRRGDKLEEVPVRLVAERAIPSIVDTIQRLAPFRKDTYRLALIGVEFPDVKHNPRIGLKDWEQSLFSKAAYNRTSATSQPVFGSMNDAYIEMSAGAFHVEGKMFDWVTVTKNRADYGLGTGDNAQMLPEAMNKLIAREGQNALANYDGVAFIYAGDRPQTTRGGLFWPHKGLFIGAGRRWNYLIVNEGGPRMSNISVFTHEFGHMIGLPDLYARPENPGSEGLGVWCLMSNQVNDGRPQHMSAWCKEQLGWIKPVVINPTVPQKLVLSPIEGSGRECFKILARADGSEYFLLENRRRTGFDLELPGEGLLIWRVVGGHPILVESHGVEGPAGPRSFLRDVPFPSAANRSFTPFTTPSSRSMLGGGLPVFITEIERRPDGRITFAVGYQYF